MKTATRQGNLQAIEQLLQTCLHSELSTESPLEIRCAVHDELLVVLAQHPADVHLNLPKTFRAFEQALFTLPPEWSGHARLDVKKAGEEEPYAFHSFHIQRQQPPTEDTANTPESEDLWNSPTSEDFWASTNLDTDATTDTDWIIESDVPTPESSVNTDAPELEANAPGSELEADEPEYQRRDNSLLIPLVACLVPSFLVLAVAGYGVTRPCVIGQCQELETARQLSDVASKTLQNSPSAQQLLSAKQKLEQSAELLKPIPFWSGYYGDAQALLDSYAEPIETSNGLLVAFSLATKAAQKSQNPPHPVKEWQEVATIWKDAIAQLQILNPDHSDLVKMRDRKLQEYQRNLATIEKRIQQEQEGEKILKEAQSAAQMAQTRQGVATSLSSWQLTYATWETAMNQFNSIPQGTTAFDQAQALLKFYRPQMTIARDRLTQEELAEDAHNQALSLAQVAQRYEQDNQWTLAVQQWREALNAAKQIPKGSAYAGQAQELTQSYTAALQTAEGNLQTAMKLQKARADLEKTCAGNPKVCAYTVNKDLIKVWITAVYARTVKERAEAAQKKGDYKTWQGLDQHIGTLRTALEAISENAGVALEVYNADGSKIGTHVPR